MFGTVEEGKSEKTGFYFVYNHFIFYDWFWTIGSNWRGNFFSFLLL